MKYSDLNLVNQINMFDLEDSYTALGAFFVSTMLCTLLHYAMKPIAKEVVSMAKHDERHVNRVVTNSLKTCGLFCLCTSPIFWTSAYDAFVYDSWTNLSRVRWIVILYTTSDAASFLTTWLPWSTWFHHLLTTAFALYTCLSPGVLVNEWSRLTLWYGLCSTPTYLVNGFIATLYIFPTVIKTLCHYAIGIYGLSLAINWIKFIPAFLHLIVSAVCWQKLIFSFGFVWMYDDCHLLKRLIDFSEVSIDLSKLSIENLSSRFKFVQ